MCSNVVRQEFQLLRFTTSPTLLPPPALSDASFQVGQSVLGYRAALLKRDATGFAPSVSPTATRDPELRDNQRLSTLSTMIVAVIATTSLLLLFLLLLCNHRRFPLKPTKPATKCDCQTSLESGLCQCQTLRRSWSAFKVKKFVSAPKRPSKATVTCVCSSPWSGVAVCACMFRWLPGKSERCSTY